MRRAASGLDHLPDRGATTSAVAGVAVFAGPVARWLTIGIGPDTSPTVTVIDTVHTAATTTQAAIT